MGSADVFAGQQVIDRLRDLERDAAGLGRAALRESVAALIADLRSERPSADVRGAVDAALATCRALYGHARSAEALSLARVALDEASRLDDARLHRRAAIACGLLAADTLDLVGAIDYHVLSLRLALKDGNPVEVSQVWNNIGLAMGISGHYELASRCYRRSLDLVEHVAGRLQIRWTALMNLAMCLYRTGACERGLPHALRALDEEGTELPPQDLAGALNLRRNLVALLIGCGRVEEARPYVEECAALGARVSSARARIAVATTRAIFELARGSTDLSMTRLEQALAQAREVPAALHDTLVAAIRAEEAAGNFERALVRVDELSQHVYRVAVERARAHVELAHLDPANGVAEQERLQARARLAERTAPRGVPEGWAALDRLAMGAVLRRDPTGLHGKRVGALVKGLAVASGVDALDALEMGLAAEVHDIGLLSIPDAVLRKSDSLNEPERAILRRHVDAGVEMLGDDRHPRVFVAREIARYHHARWDGEGHPAVGGNRIPLAARICAVADAYDAMVFGLGAHPPRTMQQALDELRAEAGGQFDPELVACFGDLIRAETEDLGVDFSSNPGMEEFQSLVNALQEDRGFV